VRVTRIVLGVATPVVHRRGIANPEKPTWRIRFALAAAALIAVIATEPVDVPGLEESQATAATKKGQDGKQERPNLIVINTDDQEDSLVGVPTVKNKLSRSGTTFTNFTTVDSLCCPSRATLLTGQYTHNHGVLSNGLSGGGGFYGFRRQGNTLPVWLRAAGYRTAHVGKYLNEYGARRPRLIPPGWSEWHTLTGGTPFFEQARWGYKLNQNGEITRYGRGKKGKPAREYLTDVESEINEELIERWAPSPKPFFLLFDASSPHVEEAPVASPLGRNPRPAPRHDGRFEGASLPQPPSFNEADVSDKPADVQNRPLLDAPAIAGLTGLYRSRLESLLSVDDAIRSMIRRLRRLDELDDTVIIFTSDNGFMLGEHRLAGVKNHPYEESMQVPLVISGPGFPRGAQRTQPAANIDLAETIADLANARPRRFQDGVSLLGLATNPSLGTDRDILYENFTDAFTAPYVAIRSPVYVLIERSTGERELYDLLNDPYQLENQAGKEAFASIETDLAARLNALRNCIGTGCH
jgi:N-acetylglucosamine-6-sulfatase